MRTIKQNNFYIVCVCLFLFTVKLLYKITVFNELAVDFRINLSYCLSNFRQKIGQAFSDTCPTNINKKTE